MSSLGAGRTTSACLAAEIEEDGEGGKNRRVQTWTDHLHIPQNYTVVGADHIEVQSTQQSIYSLILHLTYKIFIKN